MTRFSRLLLLVALGAAVALLGFHRLVLTDLIFGKGDAYHYFTPLWAARDAALRAGQLPLWTNDLFMGAPLLADSQLGTFYPPNWLTAWLPAWTALKVSVFLHVAWAAIGAYVLARRTLGVGVAASVVAAGTFALGGYVGAHAEQINQLQGIAWMPWAFLSAQWRVKSGEWTGYRLSSPPGSRPLSLIGSFPFTLAAVLALIALSGHTQTLFITGVGLGVWALTPRPPLPQGEGESSRVPIRRRVLAFAARRVTALIVLAAASVVALVLAAVQILPTLELTGLSNRQGGFPALAAMAFSWQPNLAARGLLPSLDGQVFGEYVAYLGVIGLALALWGVLYGGARRWPWLIVAIVGIVLALGLYNPLYWALAELPGFNVFRVPARWLGLFALGGGMLAALGAQALAESRGGIPRRGLIVVFAVLGALAVLAIWRSPAAALEVDGEARPTLATLALWLAAAALFVCAVLLRGRVPRGVVGAVLAAFALGELAIAATNMPHRDLVDPMAATDPRLTSYELTAASGQRPAAGQAQTAFTTEDTEHTESTEESGIPSAFDPAVPRLLSISLGYFDTYDHAGLLARYEQLGMTERAAKAGLTAAKLKEILAPNFPLLYGVPSADGFGGGLLPTVYYSAFTSLIFPDGAPRTLDGRLRELLARPECFGACVPERRWLTLMGVGYLLLDKTNDRFYDDVQFDVGLPVTLADGLEVPVAVTRDVVANEAHVLATSADAALTVNGEAAEVLSARPVDDGLTLIRFGLGGAARIESAALRGDGVSVRALTFVDTRTGAFTMMPLGGWQKILSSDVKVYRTLEHVPSLFPVREAVAQTDDWNGSEAALHTMRDPAFDPAAQAIVHGAAGALPQTPNPAAGAVLVSRSDTRSEYVVSVAGEEDAVLVQNDAYFPGWTATIDGVETPLYRADVMFRAVIVPPGTHLLVFEYRPPWLQPLLAFGAAAWAIFALLWAAAWRMGGAHP